MNPLRISIEPKSNLRLRAGVSLAEVLVSILIMSIGVVLLSTLLPISILRTAQATQLTHAVFLRNNTQAWLAATLAPGLPSALDPSGNFSPLSPIGNTLNPYTGATNPFPAVPPTQNSVIDPIGYLANSLPQFSAVGLNIPRQPGFVILGLNAAQLQIRADQIATLPDSWTTVREDTVVSSNLGASPPTVTLSTPTVDLSNVRNAASVAANQAQSAYRVVLYDITGTNAVVRPLYQSGGSGGSLAANQLSWQNTDSTGVDLPAGFIPSRVRIQNQDRRFTSLITVRKTFFDPTNWLAELDIAVFFNRSFNPTEESPFTTQLLNGGKGLDGQPGVANVDDDGNGTVDDVGELGWPGSDDNRTVSVSWAGSQAPYVKKGGFMLEPSQLDWYRIVDVVPFTSSPATILLDQDIPDTVRALPPPFNGIFLKGIVDVYPLTPRYGSQ